MAINISGGGNRESVPAGLHLAICTEMVELGTSDDTFQGETKTRRKVWIGFEACNEQRQDAEGNTFCLSIGSTYTASLGKEAKLRKVLESWRSQPFTVEELKRFDLKNVLNKPCMITVVHSAKADGSGTKAEISAISPIMKGQVVPGQVNPTRLIEFENFNHELFNTLPEFLSKEIKRSKEYQALNEPRFEPQPQTVGGDESSDLPF